MSTMYQLWFYLYIIIICETARASKTETNGRYYWSVPDHALEGHCYRKLFGMALIDCVLLCVRDIRCKSVNYGSSQSTCEMSNMDASQHPENYKWKAGSIYVHAQNDVTMAKQLAKSVFPFTLEAARRLPRSCKDIFLSGFSSGNGIYSIFPSEGSKQAVYCHMDDIPGCGSGGWRIAMKIDGKKTTFGYESHYWSSKSTYNPDAANTGLDLVETKSSAYWETNFTKLCLGMKTNNSLAWLALKNDTNTSLFSLIADGVYRPTLVGRAAWLSLVPGSTLQPHCNGEGFNLFFENVRVRIGIMGNMMKGCASPDSLLGFGSGGSGCGIDLSRISCGNAPSCDGANGAKLIDSFGYILIQ